MQKYAFILKYAKICTGKRYFLQNYNEEVVATFLERTMQSRENPDPNDVY